MFKISRQIQLLIVEIKTKVYFDKLFGPIVNENVNIVTNGLESFNQLFIRTFNGQILVLQ